MRDPTPRQTQVLRFIRGFLAKKGFPPTYAEIARGLRFRSHNAARDHVRLLVKKEALAVEPGLARGLRLLAEPARALGEREGLPVIGEVAAGQPILAQQHVEQTLAVDRSFFRPSADFLLRVRGDSMVDAGIRAGDLVAVHRTSSVRDGQVAVVRLDDEVTVKRWHVRARAGSREPRVVLEAANPAYAPIVVDPARTQVAVEGVVVGLLRAPVEGGARR
jgi:repressor LexA